MIHVNLDHFQHQLLTFKEDLLFGGADGETKECKLGERSRGHSSAIHSSLVQWRTRKNHRIFSQIDFKEPDDKYLQCSNLSAIGFYLSFKSIKFEKGGLELRSLRSGYFVVWFINGSCWTQTLLLLLILVPSVFYKPPPPKTLRLCDAFSVNPPGFMTASLSNCQVIEGSSWTFLWPISSKSTFLTLLPTGITHSSQQWGFEHRGLLEGEP